ncbi:hypothetical protein AU106_gp219 [Sinorhizobium phage phiM9]|uniref:Transmembrane protein n=1 Tax=Sinorhizobium phage phiM9 TaxID=1636182 RepID=A0A0F6R628_9CAUD|nr:hypothetical protein AU106_gp219 [Sinorhizobium phage phiM9]AKE44850.1 hypothetical protein Sm_phiM9_223 [Sinorhizobium phage phiM9]
MIIDITLTVTTAYLFFLASMIKTPNAKSSFVFKFVPFVLGAFIFFHLGIKYSVFS